MPFSRARLHHLTRDVGFLWRACGIVIASGIAIAAVMQALRPDEDSKSALSGLSHPAAWRLRMKSRATELERSATPDPAALAKWLGQVRLGLEHEAPEWKYDGAAGTLGEMPLAALVRRNTVDARQRELFSDYAGALFLPPGAGRDVAAGRVREAAGRTPMPRFASGFAGELLLRDGKKARALEAFVREGRFDEARDERIRAFSLAVTLGDAAALRAMCADSRWLSEVDSLAVSRAARITGDWWLMLRAVAKVQWRRWSHTLALPLAVLAAGVWYVLLVYSGSAERWRWLRYFSAVFAGVMSVWLLEWWMGVQNYGLSPTDQKTPGHEIIQWVFYVGIPEESVKLALFAVFLPLLLRGNSESKAALTAGCVGLGFAFDENLGYYLREGGQVAIGRLITANFLHVAMTGITGTALYELVRSRFHRAADFLVAFLGACVAHGMYDYATTESARELGVDMAGIIILAVMARIYLDRLKPADAELRRRTLSSTSVFCVGTALLVAATIIVTVWQADSMGAVTGALRSVLSVFPVALIYVREFREV